MVFMSHKMQVNMLTNTNCLRIKKTWPLAHGDKLKSYEMISLWKKLNIIYNVIPFNECTICQSFGL